MPMRYITNNLGTSSLPYRLYKISPWGETSEYSSIRNASEGSVQSNTYLYLGQKRASQGEPEEYQYTIRRGTCRVGFHAPNVTILEIKLILKLDTKYGDNFEIVARNGMPDYPHYPAVAGDYNHGHYSETGGSIDTTGWGTGEEREFIIPNSAIHISDYPYNEIEDSVLASYLLQSYNDILGEAPTGDEYLLLSARPKIYIRYEMDLVATTDEVTDITYGDEEFGNYCKVKGTSISCPDGTWTEYGFEYYREGDEGNVQKKYETGSIGRQYFSLWLTNLVPGNYHVRTYLKNDAEECWAYGEWLEFQIVGIGNIKATKSAGHLKLYGEIIGWKDKIERGFEYLIQDNEPEEEDTGTEVKEEKEEGFDEGEYHLSSWDTFNDLYCAEKDTIWWFRAYCKDDEENKYIAETWMKNVPTMTTAECTEVGAQQAKGNGELIDLGANIVTERGFRIIKEYSGDLFGAHSYRSDGFEGELEIESVHDGNGILIGHIWTGELYRDSLSEDAGGFELDIYDKILGGGFLGEGFGLYLKSNDHYKVEAIGENQLGMGFGERVDLNTGQLILPSDDEIISPISAEKTITLGTIPYGATVTRIGIRLGRTMGCNEIHVYEDGSWGTGGSITFFITDFVPGASYYKIPYIIINYGDYEEEVLAIPDYRNPERLEEWLVDYPIEVFPEVEEEDEEELDQIITDSSVGDISYRTIIREIKCERIADQSFIDKAGRRRSQTIGNHLIQSRANCKIIVDDYIEKFQIIKLKLLIDYDIPIPFEREDVILLGDGKVKYREDGEGLIAFKANGEGEILQQDFILTKIRKMDGRYISGSEAIINIELEV